MSQSIQWILLCEDTQHETFVRRFLKRAGWSTNRLRVVKAPRGRGSAEQYVREQFPNELKALRARQGQVGQFLVVVQDGDCVGVDGRIKELEQVCRDKKIDPRGAGDRGAILCPTWNIEAWFAYLDNPRVEVDERKSDYPRLNRERDCQRHVEELHQMCQSGQLTEPAPASLKAACEEYRGLPRN